VTAPLDDRAFDALLAGALAPPEGPADRAFVARVDLAVAEAERYRVVRAAMRRQLVSEALAVAAVGGSLATVAQVPGIRAALADAPSLAWPAVLALLLFWMFVRGRGALA
jgi:hypothetical protein